MVVGGRGGGIAVFGEEKEVSFVLKYWEVRKIGGKIALWQTNGIHCVRK